MGDAPYPSPAPFDTTAFADLVSDFYSSRRALVASASWALCDYALTLEQEITYVWLKPWGVSKALFLWTRYVGLSLLLLALAGTILPSPVPEVCQIVYYCGAWGGIVTMCTATAIMVLRIYAMYSGNRRIATFLSLLLLLYVSAEISMLYFSFGSPWIPPVEYLSLGLNPCFSGSTLRLSLGLWITRLAMDGILVGFAAFKSFQQYQQGWSSSVVELLVRDNMLAFVFVFTMQVLNLILESGAVRPQATATGIGFAMATDIITGTRLLLHTREALYALDESDSMQLSELGVRPALVLTDHSDLSLNDGMITLPRLTIISEEGEGDVPSGDDFTPIEESESSKALMFSRHKPL